jgi:hypothetical protein
VVVAGVIVVGLVVAGVFVYRWAVSLFSNPPPPPDARCVATLDTDWAEVSLEQAGNAAIIAGVAPQRALAPRAVSIALATAFQESGLRNLDYGDRDSLGLFQQRPSMGWGTTEQVMDPYYATGAFFDVMVTVPDWDQADIGDVAQEVQRSGFPDAYDQHVERARLLASALTGETPAAWSCIVPNPAPPDPEALRSAVTRAYGSTLMIDIRPATTDAPAQLTVRAANQTVAWSAAAFAQSWASQTGLRAVSVGQFQWEASAAVLSGWVGVPDSTQPDTTVLIDF